MDQNRIADSGGFLYCFALSEFVRELLSNKL